MWLLDANMDVHLEDLLAEFGVRSETTGRRGWGALENGDLVSAAVEAGFTCLLTQDRLFAESAGAALRRHPEFCVIVVSLPQRPWRQNLEQFRAAWALAPIRPVPGRILPWPASGNTACT
jgi:hypothetical protein